MQPNEIISPPMSNDFMSEQAYHNINTVTGKKIPCYKKDREGFFKAITSYCDDVHVAIDNHGESSVTHMYHRTILNIKVNALIIIHSVLAVKQAGSIYFKFKAASNTKKTELVNSNSLQIKELKADIKKIDALINLE